MQICDKLGWTEGNGVKGVLQRSYGLKALNSAGPSENGSFSARGVCEVWKKRSLERAMVKVGEFYELAVLLLL